MNDRTDSSPISQKFFNAIIYTGAGLILLMVVTQLPSAINSWL